MKKRKITALCVAVAMVASLITFVSVSALEQVEPGSVITLPENSVVIDGGFEEAAPIAESDPAKNHIPAFTAKEDNGNSTDRPADKAKIITDAGVPVEGAQCLLMATAENLTIALPNLHDYAGGKMNIIFYVRATEGSGGTWGKVEDNAVLDPQVNDQNEPILDTNGDQTYKPHVVASFKEGINTWTIPAGFDLFEKWTKCVSELDIPADIAEDNQYVINFGDYGMACYFDAVSCVITDKDGNEIAPADFPTPTPIVTEAPTEEPTAEVTADPNATVDPNATPAATVDPNATPGATVDPNATPGATTASTAAPTSTPSAKPVVKKVTIKFAKKAVKIKKGKKATLKVSLKNAKKATFSTSKKKIAKIVKKAAKSVTVKGMKKGKAVITAKASKKKATCKVTVK